MKKKIFLTIVVSLLALNPVHADDYCNDVPLSEVIGSVNTLNDSTDLSLSLLTYSKNMLTLSESILSTGSTVNSEYVRAMLRLSDDIGSMADKIGDMSDRILVMADNIGDMSDKIVETQRIQSKNVSTTQYNISKAKRNLNLWLYRN